MVEARATTEPRQSDDRATTERRESADTSRRESAASAKSVASDATRSETPDSGWHRCATPEHYRPLDEQALKDASLDKALALASEVSEAVAYVGSRTELRYANLERLGPAQDKSNWKEAAKAKDFASPQVIKGFENATIAEVLEHLAGVDRHVENLNNRSAAKTEEVTYWKSPEPCLHAMEVCPLNGIVGKPIRQPPESAPKPRKSIKEKLDVSGGRKSIAIPGGEILLGQKSEEKEGEEDPDAPAGEGSAGEETSPGGDGEKKSTRDEPSKTKFMSLQEQAAMSPHCRTNIAYKEEESWRHLGDIA